MKKYMAVMMVLFTGMVWADDTAKTADTTTTTTTSATKESANTTAGADVSPMVEVVDIPTADIIDPMTYSVNFRFYNAGGIASRLVIGPLKRVNLGITFDTQGIIGSEDPHMVRPSVYFKLRAFDGTDVLPALALGYDNQGYLYQNSTRDFLEKENAPYSSSAQCARRRDLRRVPRFAQPHQY